MRDFEFPAMVGLVGVVGTGFTSSHFVRLCEQFEDLEVTRVLTRRALKSCSEFPAPERLCDSVAELIDHSQVVFECSGDPVHATEVIAEVMAAGLPVVTLNCEFHVTTGTYFVGKGYLSEAEGDQPGCLAVLHRNALECGFKPLVWGNVKGFLNPRPTQDEMQYWAKKQGISLPLVTSATDGTKIHFEQALIANGLGGTISAGGMWGAQVEDFDAAARTLAARARKEGRPLSDFLVIAGSPYRIFLVAEHPAGQSAALEYYKQGPGPEYILTGTANLCHFEVAKTLRSALRKEPPLLHNSSQPEVSVASVAKKSLTAGTVIEKGIGSFELCGRAVRIRESQGHLPLGLAQRLILRRDMAEGDVLTFDDVDFQQDSLALDAWREIERRMLA